MNRYFKFLIVALLFLLIGQASAQKSKTIILIRHAEKDTSESADQMNPPLSEAGKTRAERLVKRVGRFHPGAIYSTNYLRTRATVEPLAKKRNKSIQIYDAGKPRDLIDAVMKSDTKRFVIAGHSNTIPPLANLLVGKELFKNLDDPEYSVIWVIRFSKGRFVRASILTY